jgi:hypothetical protein
MKICISILTSNKVGYLWYNVSYRLNLVGKKWVDVTSERYFPDTTLLYHSPLFQLLKTAYHAEGAHLQTILVCVA